MSVFWKCQICGAVGLWLAVLIAVTESIWVPVIGGFLVGFFVYPLIASIGERL